MSQTNYGTRFLAFGVPTVTGFVSQSFSINSANQMVLEVFDEQGRRVSSLQDDKTDELGLEFYLQSGYAASVPVPGAVFSYYNGTSAPVSGVYTTKKYEVMSINLAGANKDYFKYSLTAKASEYLTLP